MAREAFKFESLFDEAGVEYGIIGHELNKELKRAIDDCRDRPGVKNARKITLTMEVQPMLEQGGGFQHAGVKFAVASSLPKKGIELRMAASHDGLEYMPASADENPNQRPLFNSEEESE